MLVRSTALGFGKQGTLPAQTLTELSCTSAPSSVAAPPHSSARSPSSPLELARAPISAVLLNLLVQQLLTEAAQGGICHLPREVNEEKNPSGTRAAVHLPTLSLPHTSTHQEHLSLKPFSRLSGCTFISPEVLLCTVGLCPAIL